MRFILVNGRTPCRRSTCALCSKPIGTNYLREIATRLPYCDAYCYATPSIVSARSWCSKITQR